MGQTVIFDGLREKDQSGTGRKIFLIPVEIDSYKISIENTKKSGWFLNHSSV